MDTATDSRPDRIERAVLIPTTPDRLWAALTVAGELAQWFGDSAAIDLRPGGAATFGWSDSGVEIDAVVEIVEPPHRFGFRWAAGNEEPLGGGQDTHVEFTLEAAAGGTLLRVVERGFAALPAEIGTAAFDENTHGWEAELEDLVAHLRRASV
jgi:uncharacterized protein YndB with AHSA1/START domain